MLQTIMSVRLVILGLAGLLALIFSRLMNFEMRKDEQLYLPPARLLADQNLYTDFFYNHPPVSAWYFYGISNLAGSDQLLLSGRLAIFLVWTLFGAATIAITYRLSRSGALCAFILVAILANTTLLNQTGMAATNNLLVLAVAYIGVGLYVIGITAHRISWIAIFTAGIALALAAGIKASGFVLIPIIAVSAIFLPSWASLKERLQKVALPLALGGLLGSLPVLFQLLQNPDLFLAHIIGFHTGPHVAYWAAQIANTDEVVAMTLSAKLELAFTTWLSGANLLLILVLATMGAVIALNDSVSRVLRQLFSGEIGMLTACVAITATVSFLPTPGFPQYYTMPLACIPVLIPALFARLKTEDQEFLRAPLLAAVGVALIVGSPQLLQYAPRIAQPSKWTVTRTHNNGVAIATAVAKAGVTGKVATLAPVYAIEGGLKTYLEFATGQFAYRTAEFNGTYLKPYFRTTSPGDVGSLLARDPPAAILVGFEPTLEAPLVQYAEQNRYVKDETVTFSDRYGSAVLYVRPSSK